MQNSPTTEGRRYGSSVSPFLSNYSAIMTAHFVHRQGAIVDGDFVHAALEVGEAVAAAADEHLPGIGHGASTRLVRNFRCRIPVEIEGDLPAIADHRDMVPGLRFDVGLAGT